MRLITILLFLSLSSIINAKGNRLVIEKGVCDFHCSAVYDKNLGKIIFLFKDVIARDEYTWNKNNIQHDMLEYGWLVYLEDKHSDIGFNYYRGPLQEHSGTLDQLFEVGQLSIFKHEPDGAMVNIFDYESTGLSIYSVNNDIRIEVIKNTQTEYLFTDELGFVNFWKFEANSAPQKCKVKMTVKTK